MSIAKITILGCGFRGLWLAQELVKNKFDVTWLSLNDQVKDYAKHLPWQMGSKKVFDELNESQKAFLQQNFKFTAQRDFQIITQKSIIDLGQATLEKTLRFHFSDSAEYILGAFKANHENDLKLKDAYNYKLAQLPRYLTWPFEVLKSKRGNKLLDIHADILLFENDFEEFNDKAVLYAEKSGVNILRKSKLNDIGKDGSRVTGIEIQDSRAFKPCDQLVLSCNTELVSGKIPFLKTTASYENVWLRLDFKMKPHSKPHGLEDYFSYVFDPMMPLGGGQFGLVRWTVGEKADELNVWIQVDGDEVKKDSLYSHMQAVVKQYLSEMIVDFEQSFVDFEQRAPVFTPCYTETVPVGLYKKNLWLAGGDTETGFEFFDMLKTEEKILNGILNHYRKEISRDRKIHASANGPTVDARV